MWLVSQASISDMLPFHLKPGHYLLGRSSKCDIVLRDSSISRRHAKIVVRSDGVLEISDLASRNHVYVNNEPVEIARIAAGDCIRLGAILCRICSTLPSPLSRVSDFSEDATVPCPSKKSLQEKTEVKLSPKKQAIADLLASGFRQARIAQLRGVSFHTVHNHVRQLYRLYGVTNLAAFCAKYHLLHKRKERTK
jgi:DNA-binding CsgD family transcriptional regulator